MNESIINDEPSDVAEKNNEHSNDGHSNSTDESDISDENDEYDLNTNSESLIDSVTDGVDNNVNEDDDTQEETRNSKSCPWVARQNGKLRLQSALSKLLNVGNKNVLVISLDQNCELILQGDENFIEEILEKDTFTSELKLLFLKHHKRTNFKYKTKRQNIVDEERPEFPKLSKSV